jgi:hypothetical protein
MKTRSSSGVGQKIDLVYDIDSLRISAADEGDEYAPPQNSSIYDKLKKTSTVKSADNNNDSESNLPKIKADVQSTKLKSMLAGLKTS